MDEEKELEFLPITNYQQAIFRLRQGEIVVGRLVDDTQIFISLKGEKVELNMLPKLGRTRIYGNTVDRLQDMIEGLFGNGVELFCCPGGELHTVKTFPVKRFADWLVDRLRGD